MSQRKKKRKTSVKSIKYRWKAQAHDLKTYDAQATGARLAKLPKRDKATILLDSHDPASPIHNYFEWDDEIAGQSYRLTQAGKVARSLVTAYARYEGDNEPRTVRAFVTLGKGTAELHDYEPITTVMGDADKRAQLLGKAAGDLEDWRNRYQQFEEVAKAYEAATAYLI